jgi:hypothetical protein
MFEQDRIDHEMQVAMAAEGFPEVAELAEALEGYKPDASSVEDYYEDIRLQVRGGGWRIHVGGASYDQDHGGYWGASGVGPDTDCADLAADLIDQAQEHFAQCHGA